MTNAADLLKQKEAVLLEAWTAKLNATGKAAAVVSAAERDRYAKRILDALLTAIQDGGFERVEGAAYAPVRSALADLSRDFAERGLTPTETAMYVFALKESVFALFRGSYEGEELTERTWQMSTLLDQLGLFTFEAFARAREGVIKSQSEALAELSTPVIKVWDGIIALPLVGAVDSIRAKDIMERLLEAVVAQQADVVIIDITGVPVVDTQVANRLMRTVESVRLLGTHSIITGINPVIAQTLVQLGVDLGNLNTKASLHAGLAQAFRMMRIPVGARKD